MTACDLLLRHVRLVRPGTDAEPELHDLAVADGRFVAVAHALPTAGARAIVDARGLLGFPGLVDAHTHVGIYRPLPDDARSESLAAAAGGVTSMLSYIRTGECYLDRGGPYRDFYPEVLRQSANNYHVDYGYHLAPITGEHIGELEHLACEHGVASFKIFMFYGGHGLDGGSDRQREFLRLGPDDHYDLAHFEFIMRALADLQARRPGLPLSLSLHCELPDILAAYTRLVQREGKLHGLPAYSASRPPHAEAMAIFLAAYLAHETCFPAINLLHLSSRKALAAAAMMIDLFPHLDIRRELTLGHLLLDDQSPVGARAKVNPPIRSRDDVEALWQALLAGDIDWVCSDHACCASEHKDTPDIFSARSGFGGAQYLLPALLSEGGRRGLSLGRIAELLASNPARRFGIYPKKGEVAVGADADLVLLDPDRRFTIHAADSPSAQGHTPFEGIELRGQVEQTWLRGQLIYQHGAPPGPPRGRYLHRTPTCP
jgi:allantoinase